jgi:hypothetical protein
MWLSKELIHLQVDDASRSAAFYEALFEAPPTLRSAKLAVFELDYPPLVLRLEERSRARRSNARRESASKPATATRSSPPRLRSQAWMALEVAEPKQVGAVAIRLRRAGVRLWVQDEGIEAHDPDGNAWRVRCVPATPGSAIVNTSDSRGARRR